MAFHACFVGIVEGLVDADCNRLLLHYRKEKLGVGLWSRLADELFPPAWNPALTYSPTFRHRQIRSCSPQLPTKDKDGERKDTTLRLGRDTGEWERLTGFRHACA